MMSRCADMLMCWWGDVTMRWFANGLMGWFGITINSFGTFHQAKILEPGKRKVTFIRLHLKPKALMRSISGICSLPWRGNQPNLVPNLLRGWYGPGPALSGSM